MYVSNNNNNNNSRSNSNKSTYCIDQPSTQRLVAKMHCKIVNINLQDRNIMYLNNHACSLTNVIN